MLSDTEPRSHWYQEFCKDMVVKLFYKSSLPFFRRATKAAYMGLKNMMYVLKS